jgi:hypothetical protein
MKFICFAFLALVSVIAHAQTVASEPTPEQISDYKGSTAADCSAEAVQGGMDASQAHSFCTCTTSFVWQTMPPAELQLAYQRSLQNLKSEELKLLLPYIRKAARECKSSLNQ